MILMRSLYVDFYVAENKSVIKNLHVHDVSCFIQLFCSGIYESILTSTFWVVSWSQRPIIEILEMEKKTRDFICHSWLGIF